MEASGVAPIEVPVPACWSSDFKVDKNRARQLLVRAGSGSVQADGERTYLAREDGSRVLVVDGPASVPAGQRALKAPRSALKDPAALATADLRWLGGVGASSADEVRISLEDQFEFRLEDPSVGRQGLRLPQVGALHSVLGYWTTGTTNPGTVVMPTGTGKTDTMVALFAAARPDRLLVVVPSDALRTQIADKFATLGVLQEFGVIKESALPPVVGQVGHKFSSPDDACVFAEACNIVVTTPGALFASTPDVYQAFLGSFSHLFVDEAHHVEAATWRRIRDEFEHKPVLQFTATPYREDGRQLVGKMVYAFPLRAAQDQGYFSRINYIPVVDFERPDRAIAERAVQHLRDDLAAGKDHILMARVRRRGRADDVLTLYQEVAPDLAPVVLYSGLSGKERSAALQAIRDRASRIIVCVDMLGEGFDMPSLKIAAIHDPHKSLGITLQFVGRFARVADESIGEASVVVGRPDLDYDSNLRQLFAEDADWNLIVRDLSEGAVGEQEDISDFEAAFNALPDEVSLRNLEPKMSTVVYKTSATSWDPQQVLTLYEEEQLLTLPIAVNQEARVAWFVTESRTPVRWGDLRTVEEVAFDLYVLYWDEAQQLLYINSSNNRSTHETLAKAVCGESATRITGEAVYRVMAQVKRLVPTNVGLLDIYKRSRRFSMHVGADVTEGFPPAEAQTKTKTNIFANGYENGERVSIGASLKGRIWSYRVAPTLKHWMGWCDHIGAKLVDSGIDLDEVMRGFVRPERLEARPDLVQLAIEWSWESLLYAGQGTRVAVGDASAALVDTDLQITTFSKDGPIGFRISGPDFTADYELDVAGGEMKISAIGTEAEVVTARARIPMTSYLDKFPPTVLFEREALLVPPAFLLRPNRDVVPYDADELTPIDWSTTDFTKEVQGPDRAAHSIQARAIEHVASEADWEVILDDHGSGEIADVVAIRRDAGKLIVSLTHCKATSGGPGARTEDLYEVLGQAEKSVRWRRRPEQTIQRLIKREQQRVQRGERSGFEKGDAQALYDLLDEARLLQPSFNFVIAQPGLSKGQMSQPQRELLGAAQVYIHETASGSFTALCSA